MVLEELKTALKIEDDPSDPNSISELTKDGNHMITPIDDKQKQINVNAFLKMKEQFQVEELEKEQYNLEVPQYLLCKLAGDMMIEPVTIQSGHTYEKTEIVRHFKVNGSYDPKTRQEVNPRVLILNKPIKQACQDFLEKHPWAFERVNGETIDIIQM